MKKPLDYESSKMFRFMIQSSIENYFASYATVFVHVKDVNDNCPVFSGASFTKTFTGTPAAGSIVSIIKAMDADESMIKYSIVSGNGDGVFQINEQGVVSFTKLLPTSFIKTFGLTLQADDGVCKATTVLNIVVRTCQNPVSYQFAQTNYAFSVSEDKLSGVIGRVSLNGDLKTKFSINTTAPFAIDSNSGIYYNISSIFPFCLMF